MTTAGRLVSGVGAILLNVLMSKMITDWLAGREIVLAMAVFVNSLPIGIGLALLGLGWLAESAGWPASFYAAGLAAGAALLLVVPPAGASAAVNFLLSGPVRGILLPALRLRRVGAPAARRKTKRTREIGQIQVVSFSAGALGRRREDDAEGVALAGADPARAVAQRDAAGAAGAALLVAGDNVDWAAAPCSQMIRLTRPPLDRAGGGG